MHMQFQASDARNVNTRLEKLASWLYSEAAFNLSHQQKFFTNVSLNANV